MISIYYGLLNNNIDVTNIVFEKCMRKHLIFISGNCDDRDNLFTDPIRGTNKYIFFNIKENESHEHVEVFSFYRDTNVIYDTLTKKFYTDNIPPYIKLRYFKNRSYMLSSDEKAIEIEKRNKMSNDLLQITFTPKIIDREIKLNLCSKLNDIHKKLSIDFGMFYENMSMQLIIFRYVKGLEKVLEIGGNIGRCSLLIANILNEKSNTDFLSKE